MRNVLFAPDGIVDGVFPLEGNEDVVGLNMYGDGAGNLEAQAAIEKEALYIAGPFQLIQGRPGHRRAAAGLSDGRTGPAVFLGHCLRDAGLSGRPVRKLRGAGKCPGLRLPNLAHQSGRRTETGDSRDGGPAAGGCADCGPRAGAVQLCLDRLPGAPAALVSPDQPVAGGWR